MQSKVDMFMIINSRHVADVMSYAFMHTIRCWWFNVRL